MDEKNAEKESIGQEIESKLGADKFKEIGQELAMVVAKHELSKEPELCAKIFRYMSLVIWGWNSV